MAKNGYGMIWRWGVRQVVLLLCVLFFVILGLFGYVLIQTRQDSVDRARNANRRSIENCEVINRAARFTRQGFIESRDVLISAGARSRASQMLTPAEQAERDKQLREYIADYNRRVIAPLDSVVRDCRKSLMEKSD